MYAQFPAFGTEQMCRKTDCQMWVLQITGGVLFLAFGVHALYEGMYDLS